MRIAKQLAPKYTFGYYDRDDIEQEAILIGLEGMSRYDSKRPLENFLYVHISNRLKTFKRNKYFRATDGEAKGKQATKKNLIDALPIDVIDPHGNIDFDRMIEISEIRARIDRELPTYLRKDYLRICAGQKVTKATKDNVVNAICKIFGMVNE